MVGRGRGKAESGQGKEEEDVGGGARRVEIVACSPPRSADLLRRKAKTLDEQTRRHTVGIGDCRLRDSVLELLAVSWAEFPRCLPRAFQPLYWPSERHRIILTSQ